MKCPFCGASSSHIRVIDTREVSDGIRRRRECDQCRQRFTTYERVASINLLVVKRDNRREEFDREKLVKSMRISCSKRPVSSAAIEDAARDIEARLYAMGKSEIPSLKIGEMVMEHLRDIDEVAYVRYASVYRRFRDVDSMAEEIQQLMERKRREEELKNQIPLPIDE
ncbi:MAG: transcriptional repressor NrdR [Chloroflexi bacterium]|nr:MAG: transcriptional repressor NrdR [Chloroflexota bacterium]